MGLQNLHGRNQPRRAAGIAQSPAGHGITFRQSIYRQRAPVQPRLHLRQRREGLSVVAHMLVNIIRHNEHLRSVKKYRREALQFIDAVNRAGGIIGEFRISQRVAGVMAAARSAAESFQPDASLQGMMRAWPSARATISG
ncbi:hypothetical protein SODG_001082 [Sodalis praecaptivus]